jgi:phenylacetate-CoA ligase
MIRLWNFIIDRITGFDIEKNLEIALEMDTWSREEIEADQKMKFERLSAIASQSEYYRDYKGKDISEFPVMEREEFKKNASGITTDFGKPYCIQHTSGSTGYPVTFYLTKEMLLAKRVSHQRFLTWFGIKRESREFKIGGVKETWRTKIYYLFRNKRFINSFRITPESIKAIILKYNRFKPAVLYGYPSAISNFIQFSKQNNIPLHKPKIIVTHAENLTPEHESIFQSVFTGVRVVNQYWCTEANIGVTCPHGKIHLDEDTVIGEVINKDSKGVGDLLITNLYSYSQPIIRYMVGDRVKISDRPCTCGRKTKVIEYIEGRKSEEMELPDGRKLPVTAIYVSRYADNLLAYQMRYYKSKSLIELHYIPLKDNDGIDRHSISEYLRKDFGLDTEFIRVDSLEYSRGGKFKKFIFME